MGTAFCLIISIFILRCLRFILAFEVEDRIEPSYRLLFDALPGRLMAIEAASRQGNMEPAEAEAEKAAAFHAVDLRGMFEGYCRILLKCIDGASLVAAIAGALALLGLLEPIFVSVAVSAIAVAGSYLYWLWLSYQKQAGHSGLRNKAG